MSKKIKRWLDFSISLLAAILLAPLFLLIGMAVAFFLGRPILFSQMRLGLNCKEFKIFKFRSMKDLRDRDGSPLSDDQRLTRFGRILRSTSLDELPQLYNVINGDLSLVGPRPLLPRYLPRYSQNQNRRHDVAPGITGWAQVNGRNAQSWDERFTLDLWYVDNWNLLLDFKIIWMTFFKVLSRRGVNYQEGIGMPEFMGNDK